MEEETWNDSGLQLDFFSGEDIVEHFCIRAFMVEGKVNLHLVEDGVLMFKKDGTVCFRRFRG